MPIYSLLTDTGGHASRLTLGDQTFVVRTLNQTISREFRSEQLALNHGASEQLSQVRKAVTIRKLVTTAQTEITSEF